MRISNSLRSIAVLMAAALLSSTVLAQTIPLKTTSKMVKSYETSEAALEGLKAAVATEDPEQLVKLFGEQARPVIITGDPVADRAMMRRLNRRLQQRAELIDHVNPEYPKEHWFKVRYGTAGWDMYVPLVSSGDGWHFATEIALHAAKRTRKAINEITAIDTLLALMKAQQQYHAKDLNRNGVKDYATKILSEEGKRDGLYWEAEDTGMESPLEALVAQAIKDGYTSKENKDPKYEGYVYRVLTGQGRNARGGARSYIKDGKLTGGIALMAYPVKWNASGMNTFVMEGNGQIWKKDLGSRTERLAGKSQTLNNDRTWYRVEYSTIGEKKARKNW